MKVSRTPSTCSMNNLMIRYLKLLVTIAVVVIAILLSSTQSLSLMAKFLRRAYWNSTLPSGQLTNPVQDMSNTSKTPIYFLSHGGPNIMYEKNHQVYPKLQEIGREITQKVKPKAVVVFSAHWQAEPNTVEVNNSEITDLIYDFYGFPSHYYDEKYPNVGSSDIAGQVISALTTAGIKAQPVRRGLDHGVWASFKVAFDPTTNPLKVPLVQVSLFANDSPTKHYALGRAVSSLRSQGILIICSGMAVHNLRDMRFGFGNILPYVENFDEALREAVESDPEMREEKMAMVMDRKDARQAHPSFEHLLPIYVAAGAAGTDSGKRLWTLPEGSFSWAQYRFGEVEVK